MFRRFINSSSSLFVFILQIPLSSLVGPYIFLSIFLSNTESLCIILSLRTHVSQPLATIGLITDQYNFSSDFLKINFLLKGVLFAENALAINYIIHSLIHLFISIQP